MPTSGLWRSEVFQGAQVSSLDLEGEFLWQACSARGAVWASVTCSLAEKGAWKHTLDLRAGDHIFNQQLRQQSLILPAPGPQPQAKACQVSTCSTASGRRLAPELRQGLKTRVLEADAKRFQCKVLYRRASWQRAFTSTLVGHLHKRAFSFS